MSTLIFIVCEMLGKPHGVGPRLLLHWVARRGKCLMLSLSYG